MPLDPSIMALTKAIGKQENGGTPQSYDFSKVGADGERGAYQMTPAWIASNAPTYLKGQTYDPKNLTAAQQDELAYKVVEARGKAGLTPAQIASEWNSGNKDAYKQNHVGTSPGGVAYDTPTYVNNVSKYYEQYKGQTPSRTDNSSNTNNTPNQESSITGNETPGQAGMNAVANTPGSALNFGKGVVNSVNPVNVLSTLGQIPGAFNEAVKANGGVLPAIGNTLSSIPGELYKGLVPQGIRQAISGDIQGASKSFQEDPFGNAAPAVLGAMGGAKAIDTGTAALAKRKMADYTANLGENVANRVPIPTGTGTNFSGALDTGISKTAGLVTKPVGYIGGKLGDFVKNSAVSMASQLTTLPASGIVQALKSPETMSKLEMDNATRGGLAGELKTALDTRLEDLSDTGKGYDAIRNSNQTLTVPKGFIESILAKSGLKVKGGKVVADTNSVTRNSSDLAAINKFYKDWAGKKVLTPNEFLNMRGDLGELSKFDKLTGMGKTKASESIGKSLYTEANSTIRDSQLPELKALDDSYAPEADFLKQAKKDYFNPDGTLKDGAGNKIANAGNKVELLKRLENVMPGITKRIELLKIIEDIKHANEGFKVGAYTRGGVVGGAVLSLNIPAIIASILTSPGNALQILRSAGYVGAKVAPILKYLQLVAGDVPGKGLTAGLINRSASQPQNTGLLNQDRTLTNTPQ